MSDLKKMQEKLESGGHLTVSEKEQVIRKLVAIIIAAGRDNAKKSVEEFLKGQPASYDMEVFETFFVDLIDKVESTLGEEDVPN